MQFDNLIYSVNDGVAKIVLNRPESLNALGQGLREDLAATVALVRDDPAVRAVVITGAGRAFSAGGDVKAMASGYSATTGKERIQAIDRAVIIGLLELEKPVIAMVNGYAVGAGCNLALACDIVIAAEEAKFAQVFVRVGLMPDLGGIYLVPRLVGIHKAKELMFTGDTIDAREAERIGLINKVVPASELESTVMALANRLAQGPTKAIGMAKLLLLRALSTDLSGAIDLEALGQGICYQTDDHKEGVRAFLEKRQPEYKGS